MVGILFDVTRCKGCDRCVDACIEANGLDAHAAARDRATAPDGLSANRLLSVLPVKEGRFGRLSCMHCLEPSCVSACLVGAITKTAEGPVIYDPEKCIGCRYCMLACPFHIPRYEWRQTLPFVKKCSMCFGRLTNGVQPACVEACPNQALEVGDRDRLLAVAHERIRSSHGSYLPRVWGEKEWGGTSILMVSDVDLAGLGWPADSPVAIPELTESLIRKTPLIGMGVLFGTWALGAIIRRRQELMGRPEGGGRAAEPSEG
jgi:formate dehydrogenase iron-sulfur subunit